MKKKLFGLLGIALVLSVLPTCGISPGSANGLANVKGARSLSAHYVLVEFDGRVDQRAADATKYQITDPRGAQLPVTDAVVAETGTEAVLTTAEQLDVQYQLQLADAGTISVGRPLPTGLVGFLGSSQREPFLESAVSLSSTEILLTFSHEMDRESAETVAFYEIADPDGNTDIDITITGAALQDDYTTVILTTTPQENIEYQIRATNIKRRFSCADGGRIFLDSDTQGTTCASNYRPKDPDGITSDFTLTARTNIDRAAPMDPDATGDGASVGLDAYGAGVRRPLCNGGSSLIDGGNGSDADEELIIRADRPELAENVVLGIREMQFGSDQPVLFVSSDTSETYDYVIGTADIFAAVSAGLTAGDIVFANIPAFPAGLKVDAIKLRETNDGLYLNSVCGLATNRRLIDPTRNIANFWGNPPVDNIGPRVVRAESISDTEVIVSFSEPLNSDAANPVNFAITPDLTVIDAELSKYDTQVVLTTSPQHVDVLYTVTVSNVEDKAGNPIDPAANSATFSFDGGPAGLGADALPRVVGAASTGNTGVLVVFNKPMGPSAEVAGNYVIVQENVNPEVGALAVMSASFASGQQDAVELVTASQNEVTYNLPVSNVRDLSGNQLAPPQLLVDPSRAIFAGTPFSCGGAPCDPPDTDGDTISDAAELRGYVVTVELTNGERTEREVTSDPFSVDTDGDGLTDAEERRIGSDPRSGDTDADQLKDYVEYNAVYSDQNDQDTDDDGVDDLLEVEFFKTNALLADSDGDGFDDGVELYEMNRDPRIADLPQPGITIGAVDLHLDEQYSFTNEQGVVQTEDSSTSSTLSLSRSQTVSSSVETSLGLDIKGSFEAGIEALPIKVSATAGVEAGLSFGLVFQVSRESTVESTDSFEQSMSKGFEISGSTSSTRDVVGGRIDALVNLNNLGDVAFSLSNLEITVSAPDPNDRTSFLPVATLIPNTTLVTGNPATYNIGALNGSRGPIMFSSRDVFPSMVEDLMKDPRGMLFQFANYDLTDEFDRNFAYASQMARDRTVGLVIDSGDGVPQRYLVAFAPVKFDASTCDPDANPGCDIVGGFAGFADAGIPPFGGLGAPPGLPLEYILEEVLQKRRSEPVVTPVWLPQPDVQVETSDTYVCDGGFNDGAECDPNNGDADCEDGSNDGVCSNEVPADGILVGHNGVSDSIAQGDDVQLIPFGIDGLPEDAVVVSAGENGVLETAARPDDVKAVITGYSTTRTCGPDTPSSIRPGTDGIVNTIRDPYSDDVQLVSFNTPLGTNAAAFATDIIGPGPNGFIDTAPSGDDVFVGPGIPCDDDADCPAPGVCNGQEILYRFDRRSRGQYGRMWAVLVPDNNLIGVDFRKVVLHPGQVLNLGFIQDLDRDGLISSVEFLFGSSDTKQDTDGDGLDDYSEVRVGWDVGVEGSPLRHVYPDPRLPDSDQDGLNDREEQDIRRVQCECVGGLDDGKACTRDIGAGDDAEREACRTGTTACMNVADFPVSTCSTIVTDNRLDPRQRDTDMDLVSDADEVLGWLTQGAVIDPKNVIIAGNGDRDADTLACPTDVCVGGSNDGAPCHFQRDCPPERLCDGGINAGQSCDHDIDCQGPTPATSGLCNETDASHICNRTGCDDVQVIAVGTVGLDKRAVVVAPGRDGILDTSASSGDDFVASGDLRAQTTATSDDQQIALVDPLRALEDTPLGRTIIRPGIDGALDSLPMGDDVVAYGQYLQTTDPLSPDTDRDQISEGLERILGSDPRNPADGGFLGDRDGDGLTDGQEEVVGWIVKTADGAPYDVHSNANSPDSDRDGLPDYAEFVLRTDPNDSDTDGDGLTDFDELSEAQFAALEAFNNLFPNYVLDSSMSAEYGTDPLNCDTDSDHLTDDFELLVGWDVNVPTGDGIDVFHVFTDPTEPDTDFDGLGDAAEYKHTFDGSPAPPTDPTNFDSDGDDKTDGDECAPLSPALAACTNPTTESFADCASNPLVPDKKVTIRFTQLTVDRGDDSGAGTVDMTWRFQAQKSDEVYPGDWYGVRTDRAICIAVGNDNWCAEGGYCSVPVGTDFIFQGPHCRYHGGGFWFLPGSGGASCRNDDDCPMVGHCSLIPFIGCSANTDCPFNAIFGETCVGLVRDVCDSGNEHTFYLQPGEGILLNGEASQFEDCRGAECTSGSHAGTLCDPNNFEASCCPKVCDGSSISCTSDSSCATCAGGPNSGTSCNPGNYSATCCPRYCTGTTTSCTNNGDCSGSETCDYVCTGVSCPVPAGSCNYACGGITCEAPFAQNHVIYAKSLSFETLQYGFSVDIARLTDANDAQQFSLTLVVEILVE